MSKDDFCEIASAKIQDKRELVISKRGKGGYTLAQRILVEEGNKTTTNERAESSATEKRWKSTGKKSYLA